MGVSQGLTMAAKEVLETTSIRASGSKGSGLTSTGVTVNGGRAGGIRPIERQAGRLSVGVGSLLKGPARGDW